MVGSPIHHPTDSSLLWDVVRVMVRLMKRASASCSTIVFSDRTLRAKRRMLEISRANKGKVRRGAYRDLIDVTIETLEFVDQALPALKPIANDSSHPDMLEARVIVEYLQHYRGLGWQVLDQSHRRALEGEQVPSAEKIVSIFEEHTDIIVKERRQTLFGHKVCLSTGASSIVVDCVVLDGNPADATLVESMLDRHIDILGRSPRQVAFDGGFASEANLELAKAKGVKDACFRKKRGLEVSEMAKST